MKKILGLDLGTNSIGWALVEIDHKNNTVKILGLGSRILPMDADEISNFENSGKIKSAAAQRTEKRGARRLNERYLLRRDRLHLVLDLLNALPEHYKLEIDFSNEKGEKNGKFKKNAEPKLAYLPKQENKRAEFLFMDSYKEMINNIGCENVKNKKGKRIPYDWTLYYLRQKALSQEISLEELAWVLLSYNQKRGYEKIEATDEFDDLSEKLKEFGITKSIQEVVDTSKIEIESLVLKVIEVTKSEDKLGTYFNIRLENGYSYKEYSTEQITELNDKVDEVKIVERFTILNEEGSDNDETKTIYKIEDIFELGVSNISPKDTKDKYLKKYSNGWQVDTNYADYNKFKKANDKIKEEIFLTRLYNEKGDLVTPSKKSDSLNLNVSKDPFTEFKLLDPNKASNWKLLKKKTEKEALQFNSLNGYVDEKNNVKNYISPKIYNVIKNDALNGSQTKIIGGLFQVIDRSFYRAELNQIISTQKQFHKSLEDAKIFEQCVKVLYPRNKSHQENLLKNKNAIQHLLIEDILLYQRPLKSKKSEISNCKYEVKYWKDVLDKNGKQVEETDKLTGEIKPKKEPVYIKVVSASHPYFQEFRIWDKLHNLRLIQLEKEVDGKILTNQDITSEYFIGRKEYQELFEELNNRKSLNQEQFLAYCKKKFKIDYNKRNSNYIWNFSEDDEIKGNETRVSFVTRFKRCGFTDYNSFLTQEKERELWHYLYSVSFKERTANNNKSAITFFNNYFKGFAINEEIKEKIINDFANYPKFASRYCAYSEKALKKLIPLLQKGNIEKKYAWENENWYIKWEESNEIRKEEILNRIARIDFSNDDIHWDKYTDITAPIPFPKGLLNTFKAFREIDDFKNLNLTQASYLVYGRHSELAQAKYWTSPDDIRKQLHQELKQHSLNNPIAEKVLLEMMQIVADIWDYYGEGKYEFFSKIHLEVGRELNKSAKEKEAESKRMSGNRSQNKRIRQILEEFLSNSEYNANPKNHDHFERLKIAEEGAEHRNNLDKEFFNDKPYSKKDIEVILKKPHISKEDFEKYKLWLEQGYKSPYTNLMIKLTDLFDGNKYNIDHVFPQASVTNNSLSNKIVCEKEVNQLKSDQTGRDFVNNPKQREVYCTAHNRKVLIINDDAYVKTIKEQFSGTKRYILLSKDIPKGFTNSQLNNTRHISRKAMELLSHIVREPGEVEFRSKNVLPVTGRVTTELKRTWKLDQVWRELVAPRFIRLNELTQSNLFGDWQVSKNGQKYFDCNLDETIRNKDDSYDIKRIDHRHHALDALIVALCTEEHVNYINNINANAKSENYGKQKQIEKYRQTLKRKIMWSKPKKENPKENDWYYMLPGEIRQINADNSRRESVLEKSYLYKEFEPFGQDYKKMILTALQNTIVTFKQNLRVINKTVNRYNNTPNKNKFAIQNTNNGQQQNWSIRRQLSKETFYGKRSVNNIDIRVERELLSDKFNRSKILKITDGGIRKILLNHLKQFDTVQLPFEEAIEYIDYSMEKEVFQALVDNPENNFKSVNELVIYLKNNNFRIEKNDYKNLNIFINNITERDFRNEEQFKKNIQEHPEIAFTPEMIEELNNKIHKPIKKVQITQVLGKERSLSENIHSVKSKQYVVTAAGSNLYLGFYERVYFDDNGNDVRDRKFNDIDLIELIETLKQDKTKRLNPLPDKIYDNNMEEYNWIFTLSPLDLVYVPTEDEIGNSLRIDFANLTKEQKDRIYKYVDGSEKIANFIPYTASKPIWRFHGKANKEIYKELNQNNKIKITEKELIQNEFGLGSQQNKNQNMLDGKTQIKKTCIKLKVDRLGNISKA